MSPPFAKIRDGLKSFLASPKCMVSINSHVRIPFQYASVITKVPLSATNKKQRRRGGGRRRTRRSRRRLQIPATCSTVSLTQILPLLVFSRINDTLLPSLLNIYNANGFSLYKTCKNVQIVSRNNHVQDRLKHNFVDMGVAGVHSLPL